LILRKLQQHVVAALARMKKYPKDRTLIKKVDQMNAYYVSYISLPSITLTWRLMHLEASEDQGPNLAWACTLFVRAGLVHFPFPES
jgi:hypothetical protein